MLEVKDLTLENMDDVFEICSFNRPAGEIIDKGREFRAKWLTDMLERHRSCTKIAYYNEKPVAQILYYPEEAMQYIRNRRKDVIHIQCVYNAFQELQGLGVGAALVNELIADCKKGLDSLEERACSFLVGYPFPSTEGITLDRFYPKMGFKQGQDEFYLEITGKYSPRKSSKYTPLPEDKDGVVIFYNPTCEFGYFYAEQAKQMLLNTFEELPIRIFNVWEDHEEYLKRPQQSIVAARAIVNQQIINDFQFWTDAEGWLEEVRNKLSK
jgi:GNAT superfamily N-acetyltransferase